MKKKAILGILTVIVLTCSLFLLSACGKKEKEVKNQDEESEIYYTAESGAYVDMPELLVRKYYYVASSMNHLNYEELDIDYSNSQNSRYKINNYEEVFDRYFSESMKSTFKPPLLVEESGQYYLSFGNYDELIGETEFTNIQSAGNEITCDIVADTVDANGNVTGKKTQSFSIIQENGEWKINHYLPFN